MIEIWRRLLQTLRHNAMEDREEELRFHLEMAEHEPHTGNLAQAIDAIHDQATIPWLRDLLHDSRHAIRLLAKAPLFTTTAILSLALGIGANTAIFSLMDAVILRMMPVQNPGQLVQFGRDLPYPMYVQFRNELRCFTDILAHSSIGQRDIFFDRDAETVQAELVSSNYYSLLGVSPLYGRLLDATNEPEAVISHAYWVRRFSSDPSAIGRTFRWNGLPFTIIGITPPEFQGTVPGQRPDITLPVLAGGDFVRRGPGWRTSNSVRWLESMGRLRDGYTMEAAQAEVASLYARVLETEAKLANENEFHRQRILAQKMPLEAAGNGFDFLRYRFAEPLRWLMGIVALILLIACANLANLLLGRAAARRREIAVRVALGAGRSRIIRQMLAEGLVLAIAAGLLGILVAQWSASALVVMMSNGGDPIAVNLRPDLRILLFAAAVSLVACLLFSLAPAIQAASHGIHPVLAESRSSARWRWGRALIAAQAAISILLVIGAGLFGRTLLQLYLSEAGFRSDDVTLISLKTDYANLQGHELRESILTSLRSMPGVAAATFEMSPLRHKGWEMSLVAEGHTSSSKEDDLVHVNYIATDYFATLRSPLKAGREFNVRDTSTAPKVLIVNEAFARRYFNGQSPIGKWASIKGDTARMEIIGMAEDIRARSLRSAVPPTAYIAVAQANEAPQGGYFIRGLVPVTTITEAIHRVDPKLRITDLRSLDENLSRSILTERMLGTLSALFGAISLVLVSLGVYAVMATQVTNRQKEIGLRMALGARPIEVIGMILAEGLAPLATGLAVGTLGALGLTRLAEKMLYGVSPTDPLTFLGAATLILALAILAAYLPSRRAARVNPIETLRCD